MGESQTLNVWIACDTVRLGFGGGNWNVRCSGEMHRYLIERPLRRQVTVPRLTLRHESVGSKQD